MQALVESRANSAAVNSQIIDLQDSIDRMVNEKEESRSRDSTQGPDTYDEIINLNNSLNSEISSLKQYIENQNRLGSLKPVESSEVEHWKAQFEQSQSRVLRMEQELLEQRQVSAAEDSRESLDKEILTAFSDDNLVSENLRLKSELDSASKDRRQMSERIQQWTEELNREDITQLGEEGLCNLETPAQEKLTTQSLPNLPK